MRIIDADLAAHIAGGVTTLARCWRIERSDGTVLGFTDHDRPITFDATTYDPTGGLDASEDVTATGFTIGGLEASGALSSDRLAAADLAAGLYDNAEVTIWLVNWASPAERLLLRTGRLGEVTRADSAFRAEVRGLAAALNQPKGRTFRPTCDADLGDSRCGIDLTTSAIHGTGTVASVDDARRFHVSGLGSFASGWFERGRFTWTSGTNAGRGFEVRTHRRSGSAVTIELWQAPYGEVVAGDGFTITAGCDKRFATCREKFDNTVNFRGFPHMPGNDFALTYARAGDRNDGTRLTA